MKKRKQKRLDFLPNKQNKYSIRKFTVGTASILVGATLIFGAGHDEAKAAETNQTESESNQNNIGVSKESASQNIASQETNANSEQVSTSEKATEATVEQPSTEEKATEETTEQPSTEEKATETTVE